MYQVIKTLSPDEPWWFFEHWQENIVQEVSYDSFAEAMLAYRSCWQDSCDSYEACDSRRNLLAAFWNSQETVWCDSCDERIQLYHGLLLLENHKEITSQVFEEFIKEQAGEKPARICKIK